jgi:hypothetical protein
MHAIQKTVRIAPVAARMPPIREKKILRQKLIEHAGVMAPAEIRQRSFRMGAVVSKSQPADFVLHS